ncbi:MAG: glycosyltransferase family 4 protein [Actinomycetota bacterium]
MNVLIVNNMAPFVWGGAEELAVHLKRNLELADVSAEILRIPFQWEPTAGITAQMLLCRRLELTNVDRVIALKFPAYLIRHHEKVIWCLHQFRQAYDMFDPAAPDPAMVANDAELLRAIATADAEAFGEAKAIFTNSPVTADRLRRFNSIDGQVLYPPVNDPERFGGGEAEGYIFAGGRVNSMKRQHLLLEALAFTPPSVRLVIAGPPEGASTADDLAARAEELGVADRVTLDLRLLDRDELAEWVNGASACAYLPRDEDSLGYVAMEAATAGKALITTADAGGVLGLVDPGVTGWVTEPSPEALAEAMAASAADPRATRRRGLAARERWNAFDITWPRTVERLLA